jgi:hypothetical protein
MRRGGHVACMGEERKVYRVLVGKPGGKRHSDRKPRCRWEDEIRMNLMETGWGLFIYLFIQSINIQLILDKSQN